MSEERLMMEPVQILVDLLHQVGGRGIALRIAQHRLEDLLSAKGYDNPALVAEQTIAFALENWTVDKIVDNAASAEESPALGHTWFLCLSDPEEKTKLQKLPRVEQEVLRILRTCDEDSRVGQMQKENLLMELRRRGFDVDGALVATDRVREFSTIGKDGTIEYWYGLIPRYEQTEGHKAMIRESIEKVMKRERIEDQAVARDEAREKRNAPRRKERVEQKKTASSKRPE